MIRRYLAVAAVSMVMVVGARFYSQANERRQRTVIPAEQPSTMTEADRERHEQLADIRARRNTYAKVADLLSKELARGAVDLREATERLFYYCIENYPEHLQHVSFVEKGQNIKTRLARNLLRTFHAAQHDGTLPGIDAIVARLDRQLCELPYEEETAGRLVPQ